MEGWEEGPEEGELLERGGFEGEEGGGAERMGRREGEVEGAEDG